MSIYRISHAGQKCLLAVMCLIIKNDKPVIVTAQCVDICVLVSRPLPFSPGPGKEPWAGLGALGESLRLLIF